MDDNRKKLTSQENRAWAGGVISVMGSFSYLRASAPGRKPKYHMSFQLRRKGSREPIDKVRRVLQLSNGVRREKTGSNEVWNLRVTGKPLEEAIELVWEYLTDDRKQEYLDLEGWILEQNREFQ